MVTENKMEIKSVIKRSNGAAFDVVYRDIDRYSELAEKKVSHVCGYCFYGNKLVVAFDQSRNKWTFPGGSIEAGETVEEATIREIKEEANMRVVRQMPIGCQDIYELGKIISQTRSLCIVEPYGDFISDPDGDITEIKLIDPADYKKYVDWGEIGDHIMERALDLKGKLAAL
jgi:ADP-ribose pyrophosphatase YjhB (NUDIX family)